MPTFEDRAQLPYVDNVVKETLRWKAVSPLGTSQAVLGNCILTTPVPEQASRTRRPTATSTGACTSPRARRSSRTSSTPLPVLRGTPLTRTHPSAILHDPAVYKDPHAFNPDRFAPGADGAAGEPDPSRAAFGFGRR